MKRILTFIALIALSVLYLLEIDFSHMDIFNWIAIAIIAVVFISTIVICVKKIEKWKFKREEKKKEEAKKNTIEK